MFLQVKIFLVALLCYGWVRMVDLAHSYEPAFIRVVESYFSLNLSAGYVEEAYRYLLMRSA